MIFDNPVTRLVRKAISTCGVNGRQLDSAASGAEQKDSPFVLVGPVPDGRWGVFQQDFKKPQVSFDELQDACSYAYKLAGLRVDSMVLIQRSGASAADPGLSKANRTP